MAWCAISGIDLSAIAAQGSQPSGARRDIGDAAPASDGSMRVTRQGRKADFSFKSIPLPASDAFAWESLVAGEGHHFSFDTSLYSSKGLGFASASGVTQVAGTPKFGTGVMRVGATTGTITYNAAANGYTAVGIWTVMVWRYESSVWHHYVVTQTGHKWLDGVRADGTSTTWLSVSNAAVTIANTSGSAQDYDDLVVFPFNVLDSWPPLVFASAAVNGAYGDCPFLMVSGSTVPEIAQRKMSGKAAVADVYVAKPGGALDKATQVLQIDLMGA